MYIHEAINARTAEKPYITRVSWPSPDGRSEHSIRINPTNSPDCCVLLSPIGRTPCRGWQPRAEDLTADDWEPVAGIR